MPPSTPRCSNSPARIHTPPAPLYGSKFDTNWSPYSTPRRSSRIIAKNAKLASEQAEANLAKSPQLTDKISIVVKSPTCSIPVACSTPKTPRIPRTPSTPKQPVTTPRKNVPKNARITRSAKTSTDRVVRLSPRKQAIDKSVKNIKCTGLSDDFFEDIAPARKRAATTANTTKHNVKPLHSRRRHSALDNHLNTDIESTSNGLNINPLALASSIHQGASPPISPISDKIDDYLLTTPKKYSKLDNFDSRLSQSVGCRGHVEINRESTETKLSSSVTCRSPIRNSRSKKKDAVADELCTSPASMLLTPAKTPRKKHIKSEDLAVFTGRQYRLAQIDHAMPTPRRRLRNLPSVLLDDDNDDLRELMNDSAQKIEIYTDFREKIPCLDLNDDNPFVTRHDKPKSCDDDRVRLRPRTKKVKTVEEDEEIRAMEEAARRGEGLIYVFRGKKVFRPFLDSVKSGGQKCGGRTGEDPMSGSSAIINSSLAGPFSSQAQILRQAGSLAQKPIRRSKLGKNACRRLWPSQESLTVSKNDDFETGRGCVKLSRDGKTERRADFEDEEATTEVDIDLKKIARVKKR